MNWSLGSGAKAPNRPKNSSNHQVLPMSRFWGRSTLLGQEAHCPDSMKQRCQFLVQALIACLAVPCADAALVEVPFEGSIVAINVSSVIVPGTPFRAVLRYDSQAMPSSVFFDQHATYENTASVHMEIAGSTFDWDSETYLSLGQGFFIGRPTFTLDRGDFLGFGGYSPRGSGPLAGQFDYIDIMFATTNFGWITDVAALPSSVPLAIFEGRDLFINLRIGGLGGSADGVIAAPVPEPSLTIGVFGALAGFFVLKSRRTVRLAESSRTAL